MLSAILITGTFAGLAAIFGILIDGMIAHRRHTRWLEENNRRRHGI